MVQHQLWEDVLARFALAIAFAAFLNHVYDNNSRNRIQCSLTVVAEILGNGFTPVNDIQLLDTIAHTTPQIDSEHFRSLITETFEASSEFQDRQKGKGTPPMVGNEFPRKRLMFRPNSRMSRY
jgi:hypothetical protein